MSLLVRRELFERAKDFNIILDDVSITELSFSSQYTAAVEAKQVGRDPLCFRKVKKKNDWGGSRQTRDALAKSFNNRLTN